MACWRHRRPKRNSSP
ncbi:hypothetical protein [Mesorhizobium sp. B2-1-8]